MKRRCIVCRCDISRRDHQAAYCLPCGSRATKTGGAAQAHAAVARAVRAGKLKPARDLACTDCGKPAAGYDHRDYSNVLDVQPVCRSCNKLRGPAKPVLERWVPRARIAAPAGVGR